MKLRQRIIAIVGTLLLGIGGALALEAPASAGTYPHTLSTGGLCLEVPNSSRVPSEQLWLNYCTGAANQVFNFDDAGRDWWYFLRPSHNTGQCLTPGAASLFNSTIVQWPCNWANYQTWLLVRGNDGSYSLVNIYNGWCLGLDFAYAGAYVRQGSCTSLRSRWMVG